MSSLADSSFDIDSLSSVEDESIRGNDDDEASFVASASTSAKRSTKGWPVTAMSSSSPNSSLPDFKSLPSSPAVIVEAGKTQQQQQQQPRKRGRPKKVQPDAQAAIAAALMANGAAAMFTPQQLEALQAQSIGYMNSMNMASIMAGSGSGGGASSGAATMAKKTSPYGRYLFYIPQPTEFVVSAFPLIYPFIIHNTGRRWRRFYSTAKKRAIIWWNSRIDHICSKYWLI